MVLYQNLDPIASRNPYERILKFGLNRPNIKGTVVLSLKYKFTTIPWANVVTILKILNIRRYRESEST